ncbi:hypothetical protein JQ557_17560 [Bradyrhizobium sp. U87765 SZCCT0131]|uniref:hypothetical protein n=1 Tax=unclassified Bradyrhizobium TaxID=2631580 RepID=UPI001BA71B85|nr:MULTISPECIES: hypothetical protein [unclassified Bradyrhizobium]MBR1219820.1 hypothetical protein [Bradyrhizobium sp. U87765 SZCCT0131]MBR1262471.1 hypothetical protein [Bradyrhizobium sp. U87765 SZCCT0134]MBR1308346.1 hypothetical protein [Bradyrhizobium sp. U87765 SZCCT0110]MBR1318253.1 hypothetical protein [Bradyrhizobium sp. U87765 SZCCT0109]MBR1351956.1 hypothetical protein [Bradyrhizobium sp. U87765 SZCCT0048]
MVPHAVFVVGSALRQALGAAAQALTTFVTGRKPGTYDPSRHYMRGPGPKWIAKHGAAPHAGRRRAA